MIQAGGERAIVCLYSVIDKRSTWDVFFIVSHDTGGL
jgi:hypothetical protein